MRPWASGRCSCTRIAGTAEEGPETAPLDGHRFPAFLADGVALFSPCRGGDRRPIRTDVDRMLAFRVAGAAEELPEAALAGGHRLAAEGQGISVVCFSSGWISPFSPCVKFIVFLHAG